MGDLNLHNSQWLRLHLYFLIVYDLFTFNSTHSQSFVIFPLDVLKVTYIGTHEPHAIQSQKHLCGHIRPASHSS